jgi:hypothetical protein
MILIFNKKTRPNRRVFLNIIEETISGLFLFHSLLRL